MESAEIVRRFLGFFEKRGHTEVPSASLIAEDPTLLLVNAGMVPFKPYFLGQRTPPYDRATSCQKCVRTLDIDEVGKTTRHGSFFQMLGNFSFGDYFKSQAIPFAWELLTAPVREGGFGFSPDRLWATVYTADDEAADIWHTDVGLPTERIQRRGLADNYWHMGVAGPGGPCSEIYYDRGPEYGREGGPAADEERYLEIWNLVFMQEQLAAVRSKEDFDVDGELPSKNIDTGMGMERMAAILQGVDNLYEIDTSRRILDRAAELTGAKYGHDARADVSLRVIADHVRTATMLVADGVMPGNEGRGYVLRRILRRSVRNLRILAGHYDADARLMHELTAATIAAMAPQYPELVRDASNIHTVVDAEETSFLSTLRTGTTIFDTAVADTKRRGAATLAGAQAFTLHDTYGFPIDLTLEMAAEQGLAVDEEGFRRLMGEQRDRAKADARAKKTGNADVSAYARLLDTSGATVFTGYTDVEGEARVLGLIVDGQPAAVAQAGADVEVVLDRTPFYAESGGQLADHGVIEASSSMSVSGVVDIADVQKPIGGLFVHRGAVRSGELHVDDRVHAVIDTARRESVSRSHSATHLIHSALRNALGSSAGQAGSENQPGRLRFDFTAPGGAVRPDTLSEIEEEVNEVLTTDIPVYSFETSKDDALARGALAMFGQKYGDQVRVVQMSDYSMELCGGTHVPRTGLLGLVKVLGESSVGTGIRRVEALVGVDAFRHLSKESVLVGQLADQLKTPREELPERVDGLVRRLREAEKDIERMRAAQLLQVAGGLAADPVSVDGAAYVGHRAPDGAGPDDLRKLALDVRGRLSGERPGVVAVAGVPKDRPVIVVAVNDEGRARGIRAGDLVGVAATALGGGGGGKPDVAQGGGTRVEAIEEALRAVRDTVARWMTGST